MVLFITLYKMVVSVTDESVDVIFKCPRYITISQMISIEQYFLVLFTVYSGICKRW